METKQQTIKSIVTVKLIPCTTTNGIKHHFRGVSEDNPPDTTMFHFGTNDLRSYQTAGDISKI